MGAPRFCWWGETPANRVVPRPAGMPCHTSVNSKIPSHDAADLLFICFLLDGAPDSFRTAPDYDQFPRGVQPEPHPAKLYRIAGDHLICKSLFLTVGFYEERSCVSMEL
jgi:hypothetical protein